MMRYGLREGVLGSSLFINLTEAEYNEILQARNNLLTTLYLEEAFDVLIDNYLEFETTLLQSAFTYLIRFSTVHAAFQSERRLFNRKVINLLTTGRSYVEQTEHLLLNIFGKSSTEYINNEKKKASEYDNHLGYRVMEALRNHVQHYGWPIHTVAFHSKRIGEDINFKVLHSVTPYISIKALEENSKFKPKIMEELKKLGKDVDIKPLIREYIEVLADIHKEVRIILSPHVQKWEEVVITTINRFKEESQGKNAIRLQLVAINDDNTSTSVSISKGFIESRHYLEEKNGDIVKLSKCYVTNEIIEK